MTATTSGTIGFEQKEDKSINNRAFPCVCVECGISFISCSKKSAKYCSRKCRNKKLTIKLNCSQCGCEIISHKQSKRKTTLCAACCGKEKSKNRIIPKISRTCAECGVIKFYYPSQLKEFKTNLCHPCSLRKVLEPRRINPIHKKERMKFIRVRYALIEREQVRKEAIFSYGGCCNSCGENDPIVLTIDHIHNDGKIDSKNGHRIGGYALYKKLKKQGWPKERYQLLCYNCNIKKEFIRRKKQTIDNLNNMPGKNLIPTWRNKNAYD